jgi:hypothetical protein
LFADICNIFTDFVAVFCTGCVIKLVDDYLDQELDVIVGKYSLAQRIGIGTVAYALVIFALAVSLNWKLSVVLFFASYITGMVFDVRQQLPTGLSGFQEILAITGLSCWLTGITITIAAVFIMLFVQIIDDWLDMRSDARTGQLNFFYKLGIMETWICGLIFLLVSITLHTYMVALVIAATPAVVWVANKTEREGMIR